jgi:hypothetical protein
MAIEETFSATSPVRYSPFAIRPFPVDNRSASTPLIGRSGASAAKSALVAIADSRSL